MYRLEKYMFDVGMRLSILAAIHSFLFWVLFSHISFDNVFYNYINNISGLATTFYSVCCSHFADIQYIKFCHTSEERHKRKLTLILQNLRIASVVFILSGLVSLMTLISPEFRDRVTIIPLVFGVIGILLQVFCPSPDFIDDESL